MQVTIVRSAPTGRGAASPCVVPTAPSAWAEGRFIRTPPRRRHLLVPGRRPCRRYTPGCARPSAMRSLVGGAPPERVVLPQVTVRRHGIEGQVGSVAVVDPAALLYHPVREFRGLHPLHDLGRLAGLGDFDEHFTQVEDVVVRQIEALPSSRVGRQIAEVELDEAETGESDILRRGCGDALVEGPTRASPQP